MSRPWTTLEIKDVKVLSPLGPHVTALILERSEEAVKKKMHELGLATDPTEDLIRFDLLTESTVKRIKESASIPVCPSCGQRLATVKITGFCVRCHTEYMMGLRQDELDRLIHRRRIDTMRQRRARMRICVKCGEPFYPRKESPYAMCEGCRKVRA